MHNNKMIKGFYAMIDSAYLSPIDMGRVATALVKGGAKIIQLRAKDLGANAQLKAALLIRKATLNKALFIINDRVDVAILSKADGVHLGQDDIPVMAARRMLGANAIIGLSTHNVKEAKAAAAIGADYISFGPLYQTITKKDAQVPKGIDHLRKARRATRLPIVAIGGISEARALDVITAGADAVAMISDVLLSRDIRGKSASIVKLLDRAKQ